jgi:hypothetical protein
MQTYSLHVADMPGEYEAKYSNNALIYISKASIVNILYRGKRKISMYEKSLSHRWRGQL